MKMNKKGQETLGIILVIVGALLFFSALIYALAFWDAHSTCKAMYEEGYQIKIKTVTGFPQCFVQDGDGRYISYDKSRALTGD